MICLTEYTKCAVLLLDKKQIQRQDRASMTDYSAEWVFDNPNSRERYTKPEKGTTEPFSCRLSTKNLRILDEIIHTSIDPRLKTKSDCVQDAVSLFIEDWIKNYSDGLSGRTLRMLKMEQSQTVYDARESFLEQVETAVERGKKDGDRVELEAVLSHLREEYEDSIGFAPDSYRVKLTKLINELDKTLQREIIW